MMINVYEYSIFRDALITRAMILVAIFGGILVCGLARADNAKTELKTVSCWFEPDGPRQVECYNFFTRENPDDNQSRIILIPMVVFKASREPIREDPILMLQGGPGQARIGKDEIETTYNYVTYSYWMTDRDVIVADYRGLGIAKPALICENLDTDRLGAGSNEAWLAMFRECYSSLKSRQIDLSQYHALNVVQDLIAMRRALKIDQWNLWGSSYGGLIAMLLANSDNEAVRTVTAAKPSVPRFRSNFLKHYKPFVTLLDKLFNNCVENWRCNHFYPDSQVKFKNLVRELTAQPVKIQIDLHDQVHTVDISGATFIDVIMDALYRIRHLEFLPYVVDTFSNGDYRYFNRQFKEYYEDSTMPRISYAGLISYLCMETGLIMDEWLEHAGLPVWLKQTITKPHTCSIWADEHQTGLLKNVSVAFDTPILFISGELDYVTPAAHTAEILADFKHGQRYLIPDQGHSYEDDTCLIILLNRFINAPYELIASDQCDNLTDYDIKALPHIFGYRN